MNSKRRFSICIAVAVFGIFSCAPVENAAVVVNTLSPSPSSTPEIYKQLPTRTPTSTRYPTPVPISSEQILQAYFHLGEGNTCELPCFLGIVPGKTVWPDATTLFAPYTTSTLDGIADKNSLMMPRVINLSLPELELQMKFYVSLESEKVLFVRTSNRTPLSEFLITMGPPNQVLIRSAGLEGMGTSFGLALEYFRRGILAFLDGDFQIVDGKAQICPDQLRQIRLVVLWSPEDIRFIGDLVRLDGYRGIASISDTTIDEFYENYSKENADYCITLNY